jgi:hypothetical protein
MRALAPDPASRFTSASEFAVALQRLEPKPRQKLALIAGVLGVLLLAMAAYFWGPFHASPIAAESDGRVGTASLATAFPDEVDGELRIEIWTPDGDNAKRGVDIGEAAALPVRNGEQVHLKVSLTQPGYAYLLWIDSTGKVQPLYPWDPAAGFQSPPGPSTAVQSLDSPPELDRGWEIVGPSGLETVMLLVRSTPLPRDVDISLLASVLPAVPMAHSRERYVWKLTQSQARPEMIAALSRGIDTRQSRRIHDPLWNLMEQLRAHFELIYVVRFAHQGD